MNEDGSEAHAPSIVAGAPGFEKAIHSGNALGIGPQRATRPPVSARCAACGDAALSALPTFSAGSGVASRPFAEDVICHRCGHIGPPALVSE